MSEINSSVNLIYVKINFYTKNNSIFKVFPSLKKQQKIFKLNAFSINYYQNKFKHIWLYIIVNTTM